MASAFDWVHRPVVPGSGSSVVDRLVLPRPANPDFGGQSAPLGRCPRLPLRRGSWPAASGCFRPFGGMSKLTMMGCDGNSRMHFRKRDASVVDAPPRKCPERSRNPRRSSTTRRGVPRQLPPTICCGPWQGRQLWNHPRPRRDNLMAAVSSVSSAVVSPKESCLGEEKNRHKMCSKSKSAVPKYISNEFAIS